MKNKKIEETLQDTLDIYQPIKLGRLLVLLDILNIILYRTKPIDKSLNSAFYHLILVAIIRIWMHSFETFELFFCHFPAAFKCVILKSKLLLKTHGLCPSASWRWNSRFQFQWSSIAHCIKFSLGLEKCIKCLIVY